MTEPFKTVEEQIADEAADWVVRLEDRERTPVAKEQSRWFSWLQRSPKHVQAYFDMAGLYERLGKIDPDNRIDVDEWLAERRAPVVKLAESESSRNRFISEPSNEAGRGARRTGWMATAATVTVVFSAVIWIWILNEGRPTYRTDVGQQRLFTLTDGSVVNLNTHSSIKVTFSKEARLIDLDGEGFFTVAHEASRPFYVRTHDATIRAIGTEFNVYGQHGETRVAVVEGLVQVSSGTGVTVKRVASQTTPDKEMEDIVALSAGEVAHVSGGRVAKEARAKINVDIAWRHQQIVFEDASLAEVAAEFNRYNSNQIQIEDPVGQRKRLSGTFDALHPQSLLLYLGKDPDVVVRQQGNKWVVNER